MSGGISNEEVIKFFENVEDNDLKENFVGVFPSNHINKFISFHKLVKDADKKYPFIIMNTDRSDKAGTHWWSFLDLHPKKEIFLFDSFGFEGFSKFIIDNDIKTLNKILFGIKKFKREDKKITLITLKFSMKEYEKIKTGHQLRETTQDLLHVMYEYGRLHNINDNVTIHAVDDQLQEIYSDTCGMFQLYFYYNLFVPYENSSIVEDKKLTKKTVEKILNEIFSLNRETNEKIVENFAKEKDIKREK